MKGHLAFDKMYDEIEKADFILTSYDDTNPVHQRYIQYQTSGNFQLVYGFLKPIILVESFGMINGFDRENSILYKTSNDLADSLELGIKMDKDAYENMQNNLKKYVNNLYEESLNNLRSLVNG